MRIEEDNCWKVYRHTNLVNGKVYVGITRQNPEKRWANGRHYEANKHFTAAIEKYGWENFSHEILYDNLSNEDACRIENELILEHDSMNPSYGYNVLPGGQGFKRGPLSEETKRKLSKIMKGRTFSDDQRRKAIDGIKRFKSSMTDDELSDFYKKNAQKMVESKNRNKNILIYDTRIVCFYPNGRKKKFLFYKCLYNACRISGAKIETMVKVVNKNSKANSIAEMKKYKNRYWMKFSDYQRIFHGIEN